MAVLRAFFGHHRAATTWIRSILHDAAEALGLTVRTVHNESDWSGYESLGEMVRHERPDLLVLTNARRGDVATLPELRGFHVIRDPRDIIVSGYFSHRYSHPESFDGVVWQELGPHRKLLAESDHDRGMLAEIEFSAPFIDPIADWHYAQPGVLEARMEELIGDSAAKWHDIFNHLELVSTGRFRAERMRSAATIWNLAKRREIPRGVALARRIFPRVPLHRLPRSYVPSMLAHFSFARVTGGRHPGEEDQLHHYRRGVPGDWRNHFTSEHLAAFRMRYDGLVERLGYEW